MSAYIAPSQIAQRQLAHFAGKNVLVAGEVEDLFPIELSQTCNSVCVFTTNYGYHRKLSAYSEVQSIFAAELNEEVNADLLLLYWPKAKAEAEYLLNMLLAKLGVNTEVVVVGENRSGVKSIEKMFRRFGHIKKYDSARRCSYYWGQCIEEPPRFVFEQWFKEYQVEYRDMSLIIRSLPGVFSHGEFDVGSQLLLDNLPDIDGKVLDFGCGAGVIGCVIAKLNPDVELEMCDISALAVASSQATLERNQLNGNVFASDVYSDTGSDYHFIVSNPPFHSGLETSYSATESLLGNSPSHLKSNGTILIVANSFLKYPPIIEAAFGHCNTLSKTNKFVIYQAKK